MPLTKWQRAQYRRLLDLLDYAETLEDTAKRKLGFRLIQLTAAVDALVRPAPRHGGSNHSYVAELITDLESKRQ